MYTKGFQLRLKPFFSFCVRSFNGKIIGCHPIVGGSIPPGRSTRNKKEKGFTNEMEQCKIYLNDLTDEARERFLKFAECEREDVDESSPLFTFEKE